MKYKRFGKTELQMPVISCGGMRYQHKWDDIPWKEVPKEGQENLECTIDRALEVGINHIETARGYGSSEMQLGFALKNFDRRSIILQTKVAPEENPKDFRKTFEKSMKYLQQDYVDLLSLHGLNNRELIKFALRDGGCLEEAYKLKDEGRARHIGFSTHGSNAEIIETIERGDFEYVNLHWYLIAQLNGPAIEAASKKDMGVFIISPNDKGGQLYNPPEKLKQLCQPLEPMAFNDLFCWTNPHVHTISCGAARPSDFDTHVQALEYYDQARETIAPIIENISREVAQTCGEDWSETWHIGIPEWRDLPQGINVKDTVRLWTWAKAVDLVDFGKSRYNMLGNASHWFPGNPVKKHDKKAMRKALSDSPHTDRIMEILEEVQTLFVDAPVKRLSQS